MSDFSVPSTQLSEHSIHGLDELFARLEADWEGARDQAPAFAATAEEIVVVEGATDGERRRARRLSPEEFAQDLRLTLAGAAEAKPVNVSATGVLTETTHRLCPGRTVDLFVRFNGIRRVLRAKVVRSFVHAVFPRPLFRAALQFEDPIRLSEWNE